jgi:flagellar protein FliS
MSQSARDQYLETQVTTATPQRLRLMLIEAALRKARSAADAWQAGRSDEGLAAVSQCRDIVAELIAGIRPEQSELAKQVLGIYLFVFSTLIEAQFHRDQQRLRDIVRILEEERQTWHQLCDQMVELPPAPAGPPTAEEVAPRRVGETITAGFVPSASIGRSAFSMEA